MARIGLLYPAADPASPTNWSGTPYGLLDGFESLGMDVVPIPCQVPAPVRLTIAAWTQLRSENRTVANRHPLYVKARSRALANALGNAGHLDAIVAMGTDVYELSDVIGERDTPVATYDDGTFSLFARYENSDLQLSGFRNGAIAEWSLRQARACGRASAACVSTAWAKTSVVEDYLVPESRVHVVGIGHRPRSAAMCARVWKTPRFLFVGIDWKRKNGVGVLNAFARVRETFPDATLDLVGAHPPIAMPGVVGHGLLARENAAAQRLLDDLFARATAFVLPSLFEPAGIAYLEAASAGLPVICTTCGGASELLGDAAISVNPGDGEALIQAMLRLCDLKSARIMGDLAHEQARDMTWMSVSKRIADRLLARA